MSDTSIIAKISMSLSPRYRMGDILGLLKFQIFLGCLKFLIYFFFWGGGGGER